MEHCGFVVRSIFDKRYECTSILQDDNMIKEHYMTINSIWFLSGYGIALILMLYFGLNALVVSLMGNPFPNVQFITILALIFIVAWSIGLGVRRYLTYFTKERKNKLQRSFVGITAMSWIIVLILFSIA